MNQTRYVPLEVPAGWSPARYADFCYHMAEVSSGVRPDLSAEWFDACLYADSISGNSAQRKRPGDATHPTSQRETETQRTNDCDEPGGLEAILFG